MRYLLLPAVVLFFTSCGATPIARIVADPTRYINRGVKVEGMVTNSFGALGSGGYQVDDGTGKIYVVSTGVGVPAKGARVRVEGRMIAGATIMGKTYGNAIRAEHQKVKW